MGWKQRPSVRQYAKRGYKFEVSIRFLSSALGEPWGGWGEQRVRVREDGRHQENMIQLISSQGLTWAHWISKHRVCTMSSKYMFWLLPWCFCRHPGSGSRCVSDFCLLLEHFCSYSIDLFRLDMRVLFLLIVSCFVLFCFVFGCCLLGVWSFLKGNGGEVNLAKMKVGGAGRSGGREAMVEMYCVTEEFF